LAFACKLVVSNVTIESASNDSPSARQFTILCRGCILKLRLSSLLLRSSNLNMKILEAIKNDAHMLNVIWNGGVKYQVTGAWGDQCVVNVQDKVCTCRK
jgi:hypothetical protein